MTKPLIIYHKNCMDGFAAAFAAWLKFGDEADYVPMQYDDNPPDLKGRDVFVLDFSFKRDPLLIYKDEAKSLTVLDHHKSAAADLEGLYFCTFDMNRSGAVIAWDHFHPDTEVPLLFRYIQDRDLWQWQLPGSREINAALAIEPKTFANFVQILNYGRGYIGRLEDRGAIILEYERQKVAGILAEPDEIPWVPIAGHLVPCLNTTHLISEIGHALCEGLDCPFVAMYFETTWHRVYSLRSIGDFDVSEIAKRFGGGGHKNAAGFKVARPNIDLSLSGEPT